MKRDTKVLCFETTLDGTAQENLTALADMLFYSSRMIDNPVLYNQKIEFEDDKIRVIWERAPDELHPERIRIWGKNHDKA